ncbi:MAG: hypothetical protein E2O50_01775 [Gammaproteobacteria bacterium]|nr:MAG: hypothetical protein E2O50_01775 [Gammaproteobacteria bacterium]
MISTRIFTFIMLLTVPSAKVFAYVDPGTGSMALQFLIGGIFAAALTIKTYYYKIKSTLAKLFGRTTVHSEADTPVEEEDISSQSL